MKGMETARPTRKATMPGHSMARLNEVGSPSGRMGCPGEEEIDEDDSEPGTNPVRDQQEKVFVLAREPAGAIEREQATQDADGDYRDPPLDRHVKGEQRECAGVDVEGISSHRP